MRGPPAVLQGCSAGLLPGLHTWLAACGRAHQPANLPTRRRAYHALSWGSDDDELRQGLELAKKVQQALINGEHWVGRQGAHVAPV